MTGWLGPEKSLDAVLVTAVAPAVDAGVAIDLRRVMTDHAVQWDITHDSDDTWVLFLQGSLDGETWYDIFEAQGVQTQPLGFSGTVTTQGVAVLKPARYIRAVGRVWNGGAAAVTALVTSRE